MQWYMSDDLEADIIQALIMAAAQLDRDASLSILDEALAVRSPAFLGHGFGNLGADRCVRTSAVPFPVPDDARLRLNP